MCLVNVAVLKPFQTRVATMKTSKVPLYCVICSARATTEALFQLEGCIVVQKYCDRCLDKAEYELPSR